MTFYSCWKVPGTKQSSRNALVAAFRVALVSCPSPSPPCSVGQCLVKQLTFSSSVLKSKHHCVFDRYVAANLTDLKVKKWKQRIIGQFVARRWCLFEIHADCAFLYQCKNPSKWSEGTASTGVRMCVCVVCLVGFFYPFLQSTGLNEFQGDSGLSITIYFSSNSHLCPITEPQGMK